MNKKRSSTERSSLELKRGLYSRIAENLSVANHRFSFLVSWSELDFVEFLSFCTNAGKKLKTIQWAVHASNCDE